MNTHPSRFQRHRTVVLIALLLFVLLGITLVISYTSTVHQINKYFYQIFEKKSWSQLEVFHEGLRRQTEDFFTRNLAIVEDMARNETLVESLAKNDLQTIQRILDQQLFINHRFNSWGIIDQNGTALTIATELPDQKRFVGSSFSNRPFFQKTMALQRPTIIPVFGTSTGRNVILFSVPLFSDGKITHIVSGTLVLQSLADKLDLKSTFSDFSSVVVSQEGELLLEDGLSVSQKISLRENDRVVALLLAGEHDVTESEVNYRQESVLARGTVITLTNDATIILVSYYPLTQFEDEQKNLRQEINEMTRRLLFRNVALYLAAVGGIAWLIRQHDATIHRS